MITTTLDDIEARLTRIETRVVQMLLFIGADPYGNNLQESIREVIVCALEDYDETKVRA